MVEVDQVHPLLADVVGGLSKLRLPPSFTGLDTMKAWASKLNARGASDELDEGEVRQLLFDLEKTYNAFHESLSSA